MSKEKLVKSCLILIDNKVVEYASKLAWFRFRNQNLVSQATI